jgi:hypothetical protein
MKAKSDEKAAKLAEEIASMKAAKVALLRKLQDEAAKFRCDCLPLVRPVTISGGRQCWRINCSGTRRKMKGEKERELCAIKRDQTKKDVEVRKATALNAKQQVTTLAACGSCGLTAGNLAQVVIQRKTEQITAMQAKIKDQADLAKWAAQRREEREAEKAKKLETVRQAKPIPSVVPSSKPLEPKPIKPIDSQVPLAESDDHIAQAIDAALEIAGDSINDSIRASVRKEIVLRANLARSHQLLQSYIQQRRETTRQCHAARYAEASNDEVSLSCLRGSQRWFSKHRVFSFCSQIDGLQSRIAKLSCDISVLQGVITNLDRELKMPHQSQRWTNQVTDLKVAKNILSGMMACIGHLAESSVNANSKLKHVLSEATSEQVDFLKFLF